jgi:protein SCO1/2
MKMTRIVAICAAVVALGFLAITLFLGFGDDGDDKYAQCKNSAVAGGGDLGGPFELVNSAGQTVTDTDVIIEPSLIYFGYTFCPDVCPLTLADVKKALADFDQRENVTVLFISVDPERDPPDVVNEYATTFDPDFIGLSSDDYANIQEAMLPFGAYAEKETVSGSAAGYLVNHTARLYLVTPDGGLKLTYPFGFSAEDLRSDLAHLLSSNS